MVRGLKKGLIGWLLMFTVTLTAQEVIVTSEIEGKGKVGIPLKGTITITHDHSMVVDENSFMLGNSPLEVEYLKEVKVAPNAQLTISIYSFTLTPDEKGLKELPVVTVNVGGNEYRSFASTYRVEEIKASPQSPKSSIVLQIEPLIIGDTPLYPGQRIQVGYRYIFNYSQDLKKEIVPLLEAKGFRKIGGKKSETKMSGKLIHLDVLQEVEAVEPGEFYFDPAKIQGRAWRKGKLGQKDFAVKDSFAESKLSTILVIPFPKKDQPVSFNGAIGEKLSFNVTLLTSDKVTVGDKIKLKFTFEGNGELASLPLPELCCQPGMSGFFRLSDLPPREVIQDDAKFFIVEMRPLNDKAKEIPTLEFSYFNPIEKTYYTEKSSPISIVITPLKSGDQNALKQVKDVKQSNNPVLFQEKPRLQAIEIEGNFELDASDLHNRPFGAPWIIFFIPFGIGGLLLQKHFRAYMLLKQSEERVNTSHDLFSDAVTAGVSHPQFYRMLHDAFVLRLYERGEVEERSATTDSLSDEGASGRVKVFLKDIEEKRFSQGEEEIGGDVIRQAKKIFNEMRKLS